MKEKILEAFRELGFQLEETEDIGYSFCYEGMNFLCIYNGNDEEFLNISLPAIYDLENENPLLRWILPEKINSTLKYVKAYAPSDNIWLFYERELLGNEDLAQLISRMIFHLEAAIQFVRKTIKEFKKEAEEGHDETPEEEEYDNSENNE